MRYRSFSLFKRLGLILAVVYATVIIMTGWWQVMFARTIVFFGDNQRHILGAQILDSLYRDTSRLRDLIKQKKVVETDSCGMDPCISDKDSGIFYQISPEYAKEIHRKVLKKKVMFYWETSFLLVILIISIVYIIWVLSREKKRQAEREEFLTMTTHELKHPVSVVQLVFESIKRGTLKGKQLEEYLDKGLTEIGSLKKSVSEILMLQEIGQKSHTTEQIDIDKFIRDIESYWSVHHLNREGRLKVKYGEASFVFNGNKKDLNTLFNNLIENALLYSDKDVDLFISKDSKGWFVGVEDQGAGFTPEEKEGYQKLFYRSKRHDIQNIRGTGVGHNIIKKILKTYGLSMELISEGENRGSLFKVYLK